MNRSSTLFDERTSVEQVELGDVLAPKFDAQGLLPAIVVNVADGGILMLGNMNAEALDLTIRTPVLQERSAFMPIERSWRYAAFALPAWRALSATGLCVRLDLAEQHPFYDHPLMTGTGNSVH